MRSTIIAIAALVLVLSPVAPASAQTDVESGGITSDMNAIEVGGVRIPVPAVTPTSPEVIAPSQGPSGSSSDGATQISGRDATRVTYDENGEEVIIRQSTRISSVSQSSTAADRFNWFYAAQEVYAGVIPLVRNSLPHTQVLHQQGQDPASRNEVTWIGFEPLPDRTRVFIQTARDAAYRIEEFDGGETITVVLNNTRLSLSNWRRALDTSYFGRSVELIDAEQLADNRARVVIWRSGTDNYTVTTEDDFIFVEFQDLNRRR